MFSRFLGQIIISRLKKFVVPPSGGLFCERKSLFSEEPPEGGTTNGG
ncbi:hypothetical protein QUF80_22535 [Desulfococcaceae bacterium HSG8]|nr:hypothetical protein [Desulfococcaceae bacterium HSG8]